MEWCLVMRSEDEKIKEYIIDNKEHLDEKLIPYRKAFNNIKEDEVVDEEELKKVTKEDAKYTIAGDISKQTGSSLETVLVVLDGLEDDVFFDW